MMELDQALMQLTMSLTKVARSYKAAADRLVSDFELSRASAWPVVMIARLGDGVRPGTLAERLEIEPSSLVRVVDQLIDAGLVERRDDNNDRRAKLLYLTALGRERSEQIERALIPFRRNLFQDIDEGDLAACRRVFAALQSTIGEYTDSSKRKAP